MVFRYAAVAAGLSFVLAASPAPAADAPPRTPPAVEAFTRMPALEEVAISPDGSKLAYIGQVGDQRALIVQTFAGQTLAAAAVGDVKVRDVRWGDENHVLITTATWGDADGVFAEKSDLLAAISYNLTTKKFVTLLSRGHSAKGMVGDARAASLTVVGGAPFSHTVNGKRVTYVYGYDGNYEFTAFEVDLDNGLGVPRPDAGVVQDPDGRAPVREDAHWNIQTGAYSWRLLAREGKTNSWKELWKVDGNKIDSPDLVGRGRSHDTVFVTLPDDGSSTLYEVSLTTGARKKLKFPGNPTYVTPLYDPLTDDLIGFESHGGEDPGATFLDEARQEAWMTVIGSLKAKTIALQSHSADYSKMVVFTSGDTDPGAYWLAEPGARKLAKIGRQYPGLTAADVAPKTLITYKAADGFEVYAYLTMPVGRDPKNLPLIVLPHGGPQSRDEPDFDWFSQVVASRGYVVLQPQFRGSQGWGHDYFMAGQGEWGRKMQTDLSDGVRHLAKEGTIDPARVCIFGWSYGGYAALAGATIDRGVYRCAAAGAPVTDLRKLLAWERGDGGSKDSPTMRFWKRYMGVDNVNDTKLDTLSPALLADRVDIPILLIHGKEDSNVPYVQSVQMADALSRAKKPFEFITLNKEDHHLSRSSTRKQAFDAIIPFLEKYNPPN